jgi:hypothetical protein
MAATFSEARRRRRCLQLDTRSWPADSREDRIHVDRISWKAWSEITSPARYQRAWARAGPDERPQARGGPDRALFPHLPVRRSPAGARSRAARVGRDQLLWTAAYVNREVVEWLGAERLNPGFPGLPRT